MFLDEKNSTNSPRKRGRKPRENIQEQILEAASKLFRERGYYGVTVEDIALEARVSKGAIYHYIQHKADLVEGLHLIVHGTLRDTLRDILQSDLTPVEQLRKAIINHIRIVSAEMSYTTMLLQQEYIIPPEKKHRIIAFRDEYDRMFRQIIESGIRDGSLVNCNVKLVSFAIMGAANYIPHWYSPNGPLPKQEIAEAYAAYLIRGIAVNPESVEAGASGLGRPEERP